MPFQWRKHSTVQCSVSHIKTLLGRPAQVHKFRIPSCFSIKTRNCHFICTQTCGPSRESCKQQHRRTNNLPVLNGHIFRGHYTSLCKTSDWEANCKALQIKMLHKCLHAAKSSSEKIEPVNFCFFAQKTSWATIKIPANYLFISQSLGRLMIAVLYTVCLLSE